MLKRGLPRSAFTHFAPQVEKRDFGHVVVKNSSSWRYQNIVGRDLILRFSRS
jgi:hypothetical protein